MKKLHQDCLVVVGLGSARLNDVVIQLLISAPRRLLPQRWELSATATASVRGTEAEVMHRNAPLEIQGALGHTDISPAMKKDTSL